MTDERMQRTTKHLHYFCTFMKPLRNILFCLGALLFWSCSTGYQNEGDAVYYEHWNEGSGQHKERIEADPKTFQVFMFDRYAKDNSSAFYKGEKIDGADAPSFEPVGNNHARDKNRAWYGKDSILTALGASFNVINAYYSTDGNDYFYTTQPLKMAAPGNFKFVYGEGNAECWTTDGEFYYYKQFKVPSDDYQHLKIYPKSGGISSDRRYAYFLDHKLNYDIDGNKVVDTIDVATFRVTGFIECRDKYSCFNVYHGRTKCEE